MRNGVIYSPNSTNLGDDIQTFAATNLVSDPVFLDRENLDKIDFPVKVLMNGWFITNDQNWPPSDFVKPVFISFHGNEKIINKDFYQYYKKHEPIGCRDYHTLRLFQNIGIDAYFSGCLTLTLPTYPKNENANEIIIVDLLRTNYDKKYRTLLKDKLIPDNFKTKVCYVNHIIQSHETIDPSIRMKDIEQLLLRYSNAKLVITSLIHCALPCLALETPVLFVDIGFSNRGSRRFRFEGILDLMNVINDVNAPFCTHTPVDKLSRSLSLYKLFSKNIQPIPEIYFENPNRNPDKHHHLVNAMKKTILDSFKE